MYPTSADENDGEDWADYDYDEMVPMVIVMSVVAMVMFKSVQFFLWIFIRESTILGQSMMMVPMVIAMPVVVMVMLKSVQLNTTPRKRKGPGPWLLC